MTDRVKLAKLKRYLKQVIVRIATGGMIAQFFAWVFALDEITRQWLASHPQLVIIGLLFYCMYDFLMYGGNADNADAELQKDRRKRKK